MRPEKLTMQAFGPYADKVFIDFQRFDGNNLFLVTGDTGAGKTTVFDAISYALYGEASGGRTRRSAKSFRSDYVSPATETFVELEFSHNRDRFTVRRNPEYLRAKKRGTEGTTVQAAAASLTRHSDGAVLDDIERVNRFIKDLIGLDREQFSQTVMIAQGDFLKILNADSNSRIELFRKLFATSRYDIFQKHLTKLYSSAKNKLDETDQRISYLASELQIAQDETALLQLISEFQQEPSVIGRILSPLGKYIETQKQQITDAAQAVQACEAQTKKLTAELAHAKEQNKIFLSLTEAKAKLDNLRTQEAEIQEQKKELNAAEKAAALKTPYDLKQKAEQLLKNAEKDAAQIAEALPALRAAKETADHQFAEAQKNAEAIPALQEEIRKLTEAQKLLQQSEKARNAHRKAVDTAKVRLADYEKAFQAYQACAAAFFAGQAGTLAEQLQEGAPCPVCGSTAHPKPAVKPQKTPTDAELNAANQAQNKAFGERATAEAAVTHKKEELDAYLNQLTALFEGEIPQAETLETALLQHNTQIRQLEQALRNAQITAQNADKLLTQKLASQETAAKNLTRCKHDAAEQDAQYHAKLDASDFVDETEFLLAVRTPETVKALRSKIDNYEKTCSTYSGQIEALTERCEITEALAADQMENDLKEQEAKLRLLRKQREETEKICERNAHILQEFSDLRGKRQEAAGYAADIKDLYDTINGRQSGQAKIQFETYVQQYYFKSVVRSANQRMQFLTGGMYALRLRPEASNKRSQSGLDLDVYDSNTGQWRDVKTLSGGESFLASLSLALGLSDVVQAQSGGIRLDAMFIDEGFGALDEQTLRQAIQMLAKLADGKRLIGVISHIADLKDAIPAQIVITKDYTGSRLAVRV